MVLGVPILKHFRVITIIITIIINNNMTNGSSCPESCIIDINPHTKFQAANPQMKFQDATIIGT